MGAVLLGEVLWAALRPPPPVAPPPPPPPPPAVRLTASETLEVKVGQKQHFTVRVVRDYFKGPVVLKCSDLPAGVTATEITLAPSQTDAEIELSVDLGSPAGGHQFHVSVEAREHPDKPTAAVPVKLAILQVEGFFASTALGVNQGDKNQFSVRFLPDYFEGPVVLRCLKLPRGVTANDVTVRAGKTEADIEVVADADAEPGEFTFTVSAKERQPSEKIASTRPVELIVVKVEPPPPVPTVDVVFLLDVTASMQNAIDGVTKGIGDFAEELGKNRLDARIGLLAFRDLPSGQPSLQLDFKGSPFTTDYDLFRKLVGKLRADNDGRNFDVEESSLDSINDGAQLPFRRESTPVLLLITDAGPKLPDKTIRSVSEAAAVLRRYGIKQLHLVVPEHARRSYEPLQRVAPGEFFDLEQAAKGSSEFARILPQVSATIAKIAAQDRPPAPPAPVTTKAAPPSLPPPIAKTAVPPPPPSATPVIKAVQSGQEFSADSSGRLLLAIAVWTGIPAWGICLALMGGQSYYLKQSGLSASQWMQGTVGGLTAGLIGGLAGQLLFQSMGSDAHYDAAFRILGWSLLGSLVGIGMSFFVPNFRIDKGLLGGAAGGAAGAIGFLGAQSLLNGLPGGDVLGRLVGALILGFFIGLMVAWIERAFRRLWLEVGYGGREVRTVTLGAEPVSIGSNAPRCTIYVRNAPEVAYRYWVAQGKVICEDVATRLTRVMTIGEKQLIGGAEVVVKSGKAAATLKRIVVPPIPGPPTSKGTNSKPPSPLVAAPVKPSQQSPPPPQARPANPGSRPALSPGSSTAADKPSTPVPRRVPPPPPPKKGR